MADRSRVDGLLIGTTYTEEMGCSYNVRARTIHSARVECFSDQEGMRGKHYIFSYL